MTKLDEVVYTSIAYWWKEACALDSLSVCDARESDFHETNHFFKLYKDAIAIHKMVR